jgi:hypothetical protein
MNETQGYIVGYRDNRGRWHRRRGFFGLASDAIAATETYETWRVFDAEGNIVAKGDRLLDEIHHSGEDALNSEESATMLEP